MAAGSDGGNVWNKGVLATEALVQKTFETAVGRITVIKAIQVIPTHLVYNNTNYKFGPTNCCGGRRAGFGLSGRYKTKQQKTNRC
jgi:hypothetical protein